LMIGRGKKIHFKIWANYHFVVGRQGRGKKEEKGGEKNAFKQVPVVEKDGSVRLRESSEC